VLPVVHALSLRLGIWAVVPRKLILQVGCDVVYMVTGGMVSSMGSPNDRVKLPDLSMRWLKGICPRCNNKVVIIIFHVYDKYLFLMLELY
jgi:hypothetical protein